VRGADGLATCRIYGNADPAMMRFEDGATASQVAVDLGYPDSIRRWSCCP
jgi:hypothetical protein